MALANEYFRNNLDCLKEVPAIMMTLCPCPSARSNHMRDGFLFQLCQKVQFAFEDPCRGPRVEAEAGFHRYRHKTKGCKCLGPAACRPVVIGKHHAVPGVAHPIHEPKRRPGQKAVAVVVLNEDTLTCHSGSFAEHDFGIARVMQHVHKQHRVKARVTLGDRFAIEGLYWNMCLRADKNVNSTYLDVRPLVHDEPGDKAIAAANIEHAGIGRKQRCKLARTTRAPGDYKRNHHGFARGGSLVRGESYSSSLHSENADEEAGKDGLAPKDQEEQGPALSIVGSQLIRVFWFRARVVLAGAVRIQFNQVPDEWWQAPPHLQRHGLQFFRIHPLHPLWPRLLWRFHRDQHVPDAALPHLLPRVARLHMEDAARPERLPERSLREIVCGKPYYLRVRGQQRDHRRKYLRSAAFGLVGVDRQGNQSAGLKARAIMLNEPSRRPQRSGR